MKVALTLASLLVLGVSAQGPTTPLPAGGPCDVEGIKVVDSSNMCWYHECVLNDDSNLEFLPRVCALGSKISYNYVRSDSNPCTVNFDSTIGYECARTQVSVNGPPPCHDANVRLNCLNGGEATYESDKCWCDCPVSWQGDFDCGLPTQNPVGLPASSNICVDGQPLEDWCSQPGMGCLNNGICYNQCDTFWCECPNREQVDYYGKRCELPPGK